MNIREGVIRSQILVEQKKYQSDLEDAHKFEETLRKSLKAGQGSFKRVIFRAESDDEYDDDFN